MHPNLNSIFFLVPLLLLLFSCQHEESPIPIQNEDPPILYQDECDFVTLDCVFVQNDEDKDGLIDDFERAIMVECSNNQKLSKTAIENNLIGDWDLIGHGEGWISTPSQPCGRIVITDDELTLNFKNGYLDTVMSYSWLIEEVNLSTVSYFKLKTVPENYGTLFLNNFCECYMFGDATESDGNMYLYQKIN